MGLLEELLGLRNRTVYPPDTEAEWENLSDLSPSQKSTDTDAEENAIFGEEIAESLWEREEEDIDTGEQHYPVEDDDEEGSLGLPDDEEVLAEEDTVEGIVNDDDTAAMLDSMGLGTSGSLSSSDSEESELSSEGEAMDKAVFGHRSEMFEGRDDEM